MRPCAALLACALYASASAGDAQAQPTDAVRIAPAQSAGAARPAARPEQTGRVVIVVVGILVSAGFVLSWTGITGLVYQATQHRSVPWAAPVSIASIPFEIVGSMLVVAGAIELLRQPPVDPPSSEPPAPTVASARPVLTLPLVHADF